MSSARSARHTSKPSMSGSMTSRTISRTGPIGPRSSASAPVAASSVANPSNRSADDDHVGDVRLVVDDQDAHRPVTAVGSGPGSAAGRLRAGSDQALEPPPGHQAQRLDHDEHRHLRLALHPVDEPDRAPRRSRPRPAGPRRSSRSGSRSPRPGRRRGRCRREERGRVGPEPGGGVGHPEAEQGRGVEVAAPGQQPPVPGPVGDDAARDVPRADDQLAPVRQRAPPVRAAPRARGRGRRPSRCRRRSPRSRPQRNPAR